MSSSPTGRRRSRREFHSSGAQEENDGFFNDSINGNANSNGNNAAPPMVAAIPISGKSTPQDILKASRNMQQKQMNNINNMRGIGSMNVLPITPENNEYLEKHNEMGREGNSGKA